MVGRYYTGINVDIDNLLYALCDAIQVHLWANIFEKITF